MSNEKRQSIRDAFQQYIKNPELNADKLLAPLNNYREAWTQERRNSQDRIWQNAVSFYAGNHYVRDNHQGATPYRVRLRENHTNNIMNRMVSIFVQNLPVCRVFPSSHSHKDVRDAETTEMYGKYYWRTKKLEQKLGKLIKYSTIFGSSFVFRNWDPNLGGKLMLDGEESGTGQPEITPYRGDIKVDIDDPFKIAVRPGIDEIDDMYDFFRSVPASRSDIEKQHGELEADSAVGMNAYSGQNRQDDDLVMLHHYYHKPTPWFEEGMYVCYAGKKLLKVSTFPYADGLLPINHLPFDKAPMRFYGTSSIEQVMDLQEQLNRAASMIVEARNLVARPRVLAPNQCKVPGQSLTDRPGEILRFDGAGGLRPTFEVPSFNFGEMAAHKGDVRNAMSQVMGITSASRGEIPSATKTALALQLVLEQDRSQFLPFIKQFHQTILDMMQGIFGLAADFLDEDDPRVIKIEGNVVTTRTFHGGMVPSPLDIYLEDTNPLGWTAAGRVEQIQNLVQMGVVTDKNQILEMLKMNMPDPAYEFVNINRRAAEKENELLSQGEFMEIGPEDDDGIHLDEHVKPVASFEFRKRPEAVRAAYEAHIQAHKERLMANAPQGMPAGGVKGVPSSASQAPQGLRAPNPGDNLEVLLTSSRGG